MSLHAAREAEALAQQKARDLDDEHNLFPRASIQRLLKDNLGIPVNQAIEKSAVRAINLSAVDFCTMITNEAHYIRQQEKQLRTQISIRQTMQSVKRAQQGNSADEVDIPPDVMRRYEESLSEPLVSDRSVTLQGDGSVLTGHHILSALHRLGFSQIARVCGSQLLNQIMIPNEDLNDSLQQMTRDAHMRLRRTQPIMKLGAPQDEADMHIPTEPTAQNNIEN